MRGWVTGVLVALSLLGVGQAHAQRLGGQRWTPAGSEDGVLGTEGADRRLHFVPYAALWLHYTYAPVIVVDGAGDRVGPAVEHVLGADLVASMSVWEGLEFGINVPVTLFSAGSDTTASNAGLPLAPGTAMGDLALRVAYRFRVTPDFALALHVPVLLPTNADDNVLALGLGVKPTIAALGRIGPVELLANVWTLIRESHAAVDYRGGSELGVSVAGRLDVSGQWRTALLAELGFSSAFDGFFQPATTPAEARLGFEHWFGRHFRLAAFVGRGIGPGVGAPDFRAGISFAYGDNPHYRPRPAPTAGDRDGDGILDTEDQCPDEAEDPDGFEDDDGCPDDDNDSDGVLDVDDACPTAPESQNGISDDDGCPDLIELQDTLITTFDRVHFRTGSDEILPDSHPMLEEVAAVLRVNPDLHIRVEGHTDSVGDDQHNLELSQSRADSVRQFLIDHGASGGQVEAIGYGETRPLQSNDTAEGRRRNRRVEFHIEGGNE